jgi:hypothetical protein
MRITRAGLTLTELVVALTLGTIVVALYAGSVVGQRRAERASAGALLPASAADDAVRTISSALARVSAADSLWSRADTALEWRATVGVALACVAGADTVVVPDTGANAWWESFADSGDFMLLGSAAGTWERHSVAGVHTRALGGPCGIPQHILAVREPVVATGALLARVTRRERFMLYRGGDGLWWFGQRSCDEPPPVHCTAAQPIAGPLDAPPTGLRMTIDTVAGRARVTVVASVGRVVRTATVTIQP